MPAEHIAERPSWDCRACGKAWPCEPARERLVKANSLTAVAVTMWVHLEEAARDMPNTPVGEMFDRFISWTWSAVQAQEHATRPPIED